MDTRIEKLVRTLKHVPDSRPIMYFISHALRATGELHVIAVLMECWMSVVQGARPDLTLLATYWAQTIEHTTRDVRFLARRLFKLEASPPQREAGRSSGPKSISITLRVNTFGGRDPSYHGTH